ncbi:guanine deaminase, isoform CRA_b [Dichotomocladium elegans]|nr:guanine deaminase, isoform CRA_b [Dichotomocladium elegans]
MLIYGTLVHTPTRGELTILENTLLVTDTKGDIIAVASNVDETELIPTIEAMGQHHQLKDGDIIKMSSTQFLLPGFVDTHIHAPQIAYAGTGTDVPLMDWLKKYAYPAEKRFADVSWAKQVYPKLVDRLLRNGTTTALYFATIHLEASMILAETAFTQGQRAFVGKAVITPRFLPSCSSALLARLGILAREKNLPIQSHISESLDEIRFVATLYGEDRSDTCLFDQFGLLTPKTVLAHGVHLSSQDTAILIERQAGIAVCPLSNAYFANGIYPLQAHKEVKTGLGTDIAGGYSPSMLNAIRHLAVASRHLCAKHGNDPSLIVDWVTGLHLATMGGATCLGLENRVGSFEVGKQFDALLIDLNVDLSPIDLFDETEGWADKVEKFINLGDDRNILTVWVGGRRVAHAY